MEENKLAYNYSIRILSRKDYSVYKMQQKLKGRGHSKEIIDKTVDKLVEQNYIRENEYKRIRIKTLLVKKYSDSYIIQKCSQEMLDISKDDIDIIRKEYDIHDNDTIKYLIEKKLRYKEIPTEWESKMKLKSKIMNFLKTKGYSYDLISKSISEFF
jgi:regulatory protein